MCNETGAIKSDLMRIHIRQTMQQWRKSTQKVENRAVRIKRTEATQSPKRVNAVTHACVTHRISTCKLQRDSRARLKHDTLQKHKKTNHDAYMHSKHNTVYSLIRTWPGFSFFPCPTSLHYRWRLCHYWRLGYFFNFREAI